jgi:activator of HSP90 ATPase
MTPAIQQSVEFDAPVETLYDLYMDSKQHSLATGAPAKVSRKAGGAFTAFDGQLRGKNLLVVPGQMIVQTWRAEGWKKTDPDSILVIRFSKTKTGGRVDLVHVNVPEYDHQGVTDGWRHYYWEPWQVYLEAVSLKKAAGRAKRKSR